MDYVTAQGLQIPKLGYGTFRLSGEACYQGVVDALAVGYRHIDTAQGYRNEDQVGQAIAASGVPRDEIFLTTKLRPDNLTSEAVRTSTEESLAQLETDYVDLLLIHWPNPAVSLAETLEAMMGLQREGMIRGIGVSNFPPSWVRQAVAHTAIAANQVEYHAYLSQEDLLVLAREHGHTLTAYSPLAQGALIEEPVVAQIAKEHDATPAQVAIAWLLAQERVTAIPKATARERIEANIAAADLRLSDEELRHISALDRGSAGRVVTPDHAPDWERTD